MPPGVDWRRFFFPALVKATVFVPIVSQSFFFSKACEDEATFAWDKRKVFVPILHDYDDMAKLLAAPEQFLDRNGDICEVVPKLESFFNQCNRIPGTGKFEDDFEDNMEALIEVIKYHIQAKHSDDLERQDSLPSIDDVSEQIFCLRDEKNEAAEFMSDEQALQLIQALESGQRLRGITENVRFLTRSVTTRKRLVANGITASLVGMLRKEGVLQREDVVENVLGSLRNLTGAPEYLRVSTMLRWQADWTTNIHTCISHGALPLFLKVIYSGACEVKTREAAITSLANCCEGQFGRNTMLLDSKDIQKLMGLLNVHSTTGQQPNSLRPALLHLMRSIVFSRSPPLKRAVVIQEGGVDLAMSYLIPFDGTAEQNIHEQYIALDVLAGLSTDVTTRHQMIDGGVIEAAFGLTKLRCEQDRENVESLRRVSHFMRAFTDRRPPLVAGEAPGFYFNRELVAAASLAAIQRGIIGEMEAILRELQRRHLASMAGKDNLPLTSFKESIVDSEQGGLPPPRHHASLLKGGGVADVSYINRSMGYLLGALLNLAMTQEVWDDEAKLWGVGEVAAALMDQLDSSLVLDVAAQLMQDFAEVQKAVGKSEELMWMNRGGVLNRIPAGVEFGYGVASKWVHLLSSRGGVLRARCEAVRDSLPPDARDYRGWTGGLLDALA